MPEFLPVLTCTQDPCGYCGTPDDRRPARTFHVAHPSGPFNTYIAALSHAQRMAHNVYGASTHHADVIQRATYDELRECLIRLLKHNRGAIHPSKGMVDAKLIRSICDTAGLDEDDFLDRIYLRDKKGWGLE